MGRDSTTGMNRYQRDVVRLDRRHRWLVRALFHAAACSLAGIVLWFVSLNDEPRPSTGARTAVDLAPASGAQVTPGTSHVLPPGVDSGSPEKPAALYLISSSPGATSREGTARIGTNPGNPQKYAAGALLANGARLTEIHADYLVLRRGHLSARLALFDAAGRGAAAVHDELLIVGANSALPPTIVTSRTQLTDYLRPNPLYEGERLRGFEVYAGRKSHVFAQLGLRPGDVITAIDHVPLSDPAQAIAMFQQLIEGNSVTATVERAGEGPLHLTLDGALIAADAQSSRDASMRRFSAEALPSS